MLFYCKKCGRMLLFDSDENTICDCCNSFMYNVPDEYIDLENYMVKSDLEQQFIDQYIKSSPEFDKDLFNHRDEYLFKRMMATEAQLEHENSILEKRNKILEEYNKGNEYGISCPYCHSTNINKISTSSKVMHTVLFGIFSISRNGKNFHCNHCGADF